MLVLQWPATLEEPPIEEVSAVEEGETWTTPLIRYMEADILPEDRSEGQKDKEASREVLYLLGEAGTEIFLWPIPEVCHTPRSR